MIASSHRLNGPAGTTPIFEFMDPANTTQSGPRTRIGYLVPEFPGQTHNFFWREIVALREQGVEPVLISTRLPAKSLMSTSWGAEAVRQTQYLFPLRVPELLACVAQILGTAPRRLAAAWALVMDRQAHGQGRLKMFGFLLMAARLRRIAKAKGLDHVHVHSCGNAANIAMLARVLGGPTYGLTLHNPLATFGGNQPNKWSHASYGIVITDQIWNEIKRDLQGWLPPLIGVAPMGIEADRFSRRRPYPAYSEGERFRLVSCARLNFAKGHLDAIDAIAHLKRAGRNVELLIAGEDDAGGNGFRKDVERRIDELALAGCVKLLGAISEDEILDLLETAHLFVLASHEEPLGVALMEAMSMEVPVVSTNAGGVPSLVRDGRDGVLVPPRNVQALAAAISTLIELPLRCLAHGRSGRARVVEQFSSRRSARLIRAYVDQKVGLSNG